MLPDIETVIERGLAAAALLKSELFAQAMNDIANFHTVAMIAALEGPTGTDAREHHHRMLAASREIVDQLRLYEAAGAEAQERLETLEETD